MASRKTAQQKREERFNAEMNEERYFKRALSNLENLEEAQAFVKSGPRLGEPGGELYANFEAFLMYGDVKPTHWAGASSWERELYAAFNQRRGLCAQPK